MHAPILGAWSRHQTRIVFCFILVLLISASCSSANGPEETGHEPSSSSTLPGTGDAATLIIDVATVPSDQAGTFRFTGVPTGTLSVDSTLVVTDLSPGTYTSTQVDPSPDFDLTAVECNDGGSASPSQGDAQTRTAIFNLDAGETVRCTFTNTRRGAAVIMGQTVPEGTGGSFRFTGVPTGTISSNGTLVVANLSPGTYTSTQVDPAPGFDVTAVTCDDGDSASPSQGDAQTRTAIFDVDPAEMVRCTFTNTRRGTVVVVGETVPEGAGGDIRFTGVPSGTIAASGTLVVANLRPGTYTSTQVDPAPDFELTAITCDDGNSASPSQGDAQTRTAIFDLDPGETVRCTFTNDASKDEDTTPTGTTGRGEDTSATGDTEAAGAKSNPFTDPEIDLTDFPLPESLPPGAGTFAAPRPGTWSAINFTGQMDCGVSILSLPASPAERGTLEVSDDGQTVIATSLHGDQAGTLTLSAHPEIMGRYTGSAGITEQGLPVTADFYWQVVTDEYIVGFLTASVSQEGVTCRLYRPFELTYVGQ